MARPTTLTDLPDEILRNICFLIDWTDALLLQTTCRRFGNIISEHLLWKHYCRNTFRYWSAKHQLPTKVADSKFLQWQELFKQRYRAGVKTQSALDDIILIQRARTPKIDAIVALGYDSKDVLLQNRSKGPESNDYLARRYWSYVVLGCLHRSLALQEWTDLKYRAAEDDSYERTVGAFDLFVLDDAPEGDLDDITMRLDEYVERLRRAHPDIDDQSPRQKASTVAQFLISNNLVAIREGRDYYNLEHNFLGRALFSREKNSLPIITAIIYCYILRQLGLGAAPCGFPFHVHAIVHPPPGTNLEGEPLPLNTEQPCIYMDPFRTATEVPLSTLDEQIDFLGPLEQPADRDAFISRADPLSITLRCARNIDNSQRSTGPSSSRPIDPVSAEYAAMWALIFLQDFPTLLLMHFLVKNFPHDVSLAEKYLQPLDASLGFGNVQMCQAVRRADLIAPLAVKSRVGSRATSTVKHRVGQVFQHQRYGYHAVVTGWDAKCDADEEWVLRMGVDRLESGRRQAFYHAFNQEDKSMRYVAEENLKLVDGDRFNPDIFPLEIGKWFKRWDGQRKVFVSNITDEYPDD